MSDETSTRRGRPRISFVRLTDVPPDDILAHMADPRVAVHLPLMTKPWDRAMVDSFIAAKEACWQRDGLGHWAILDHDRYVGWGGFQLEDGEWDFGLVLRADCFGLGPSIARAALEFARSDARISHVTALLPPSRTRLAALRRFGARAVGEVTYDGQRFLKFRIDTA
jgi:hypothetical protein